MNNHLKKSTMGEYFYPLARGPWGWKVYFSYCKLFRLTIRWWIHRGVTFKDEQLHEYFINTELLLMVSIRTRSSCLMKKIRHKKCHDTIILIYLEIHGTLRWTVYSTSYCEYVSTVCTVVRTNIANTGLPPTLSLLGMTLTVLAAF